MVWWDGWKGRGYMAARLKLKLVRCPQCGEIIFKSVTVCQYCSAFYPTRFMERAEEWLQFAAFAALFGIFAFMSHCGL